MKDHGRNGLGARGNFEKKKREKKKFCGGKKRGSKKESKEGGVEYEAKGVKNARQ